MSTLNRIDTELEQFADRLDVIDDCLTRVRSQLADARANWFGDDPPDVGALTIDETRQLTDEVLALEIRARFIEGLAIGVIEDD